MSGRSSATERSLTDPRHIAPTPHVRKVVGRTICDYRLIRENDHILVAVSGGKDSWSLLHLLLHFQKVSPVTFQITAITIDPGFPDFNTQAIHQTYQRFSSLNWQVIRTNIADTIERSNETGKNPCAFCARLRRGALYRIARETGCNTVALGHHADDAVETVFISSLFEGTMVSMPPRLSVASGKLTLIRPLIRIWETDLAEYCSRLDISPVNCGGHNDSGAQIRKKIKSWLQEFFDIYPQSRKNLLASLQNIKPDHFLDKKWL